MRAKESARRLALGRAVLGAGLMLAPGLGARGWLGDAAAIPEARMVARGLGARDVALAVGTLRSLDSGASTRGWIEGGVLADAADLVATFIARRHLPPVGAIGVSALAGYAALEGLRIARSVDAVDG